MPKKKAISKTACECCWESNGPRHPHHPHPKSQGGEDKGTVEACLDCHSLYHSIVGQRLAKYAKDRAVNHNKWYIKMKPGVSLMGKKRCNPNIMAPEFVLQEWDDYCTQKKAKKDIVVTDRSGGCLSRHGKVKTYPVREHLKGDVR